MNWDNRSLPEIETLPLPAAPRSAPRPSADPRPERRPPTPTSPSKVGTAWLQWLRLQGPMLLIFIIAAYLLTINVSSRWQSADEMNAVIFQSAALNHIRFGLDFTKGRDVVDDTVVSTADAMKYTPTQLFDYFLNGNSTPRVYPDHPPLLGLTIAGSFLVFGYHNWAERLVPIAYSLAGLVLFYLLVARVFDVTIARVASALYVTFPLMAYYGRDVDHEAPTLFWALLLLTGYVRWRERGGAGWLVLMAGSIVIGGFYGWPLFYFAFILFGIDWLARRRFNPALAMATLVPAVITFSLVIAQIAWALGGDLSVLIHVFFTRIGGGRLPVGNGKVSTTEHLSTIAWINKEVLFNQSDFGAWALLISPLVAAFIAARASVERWSLRVQLVVVTGLWGISHMLIFRDGAAFHAYWQQYLLPFFALAIAWAVVGYARALIPNAAARTTAIVAFVVVAALLNVPTIINLYTSNGIYALHPAFDIWR